MIDAYAHCGISRYLPVEDLRAVMQESGVERAVLCQHLGEYDNDYLASVVTAEPERFAAVALVDGRAPGWRSALGTVVESGAFRGLRVVDEVLVENPELAETAASLGLAIVVYTPRGVAWSFDAVMRLATAHPETTIVLTHLGTPTIENGVVGSGAELIDLAAVPNLVVTLSGLSMFCDYPHEEIDDLIAAAVSAFGPERLLWGSNFPVGGEDAAAYVRDADLVRSCRWGLDHAAAEQIVDGNARRIWFDGRDA